MKLTIPTSWADVTLKQYKQIAEVPSLGFKDELDNHLRVLSILTGIDDTEFLDLPLKELNKVLLKIKFIYKKPKDLKIQHKIKIGKQRYRVNYLPSQLDAGEYIDLTNYTKDESKIIENMPKIVAVFLKPINFWGGMQKGNYKVNTQGRMSQTMESREATAKLADNLTMDIIFPMSDFFLKTWERSIEVTKAYFLNERRKAMNEARKQAAMVLPKSMVGNLR